MHFYWSAFSCKSFPHQSLGCLKLILFLPFSFLPETKGIPLEEIDILFGSVSHREKGEDVLERKIKAQSV
jgi:hypothetical protein